MNQIVSGQLRQYPHPALASGSPPHQPWSLSLWWMVEASLSSSSGFITCEVYLIVWRCDVTWRRRCDTAHNCHVELSRVSRGPVQIGSSWRFVINIIIHWTELPVHATVFNPVDRGESRLRWHRVPTLFSCPRVCCDWIVWLNYTSIIKIIFPPHKIIYKWWISGCCAAARCLFSRFQTSVCQFWHRCKKMLNNIWRHYALLTYIVSPPLLGHLCTKLITNRLCSLVSKDP